MKQTINRKGNPGMLRVDGRPDRSKAPLIKPQPKVQAVTLITLDPTEPYPQQDEIKPSGVSNSYTMEKFEGDIILTSKTKKKWSS